jgi:tRNA modification GTPase
VLALAPSGAALAVVNKRDRMAWERPPWIGELGQLPHVAVSALTGEGLPDLERSIVNWALRDDKLRLEDAMITNLRQQDAARRASEALEEALRGMKEGRGEELLAVDLSRALDALGDIVGETTADDLLNRIFAEFCIGK